MRLRCCNCSENDLVGRNSYVCVQEIKHDMCLSLILDLFADVTGGTVGKLRSYVLAYAAMPDALSAEQPNIATC